MDQVCKIIRKLRFLVVGLECWNMDVELRKKGIKGGIWLFARKIARFWYLKSRNYD